MGNDVGQFFLVVGHHHHRLVASLTEGLYHVLHQTAVPKVESMQRLVEDKQLWVFHESTCQQHQSLFATRQFHERVVVFPLHAENVKPPFTDGYLVAIGFYIQSYAVLQSAGHNAYHRQVALIRTVHLGRDGRRA